VTCLCLTRNRRQWIPKAIRCFLQQTYRNAELLIVADGDEVRDLIPNEVSIRLIHLSETRNIGEKRNFGCSRARGDVICHWDDDDYSAPARIGHQVEMLSESGLAVAGFHSMKFTDGENWWKYKGARNYSLGTALCYRREWWEANPFKPMPIGEDNEMVYAAQRAQQIVSEDAGELMYATIHDANTSPRMITQSWEKL
jgi:glycosyltransferase involved in cell wall biosynthesis